MSVSFWSLVKLWTVVSLAIIPHLLFYIMNNFLKLKMNICNCLWLFVLLTLLLYAWVWHVFDFLSCDFLSECPVTFCFCRSPGSVKKSHVQVESQHLHRDYTILFQNVSKKESLVTGECNRWIDPESDKIFPVRLNTAQEDLLGAHMQDIQSALMADLI